MRTWLGRVLCALRIRHNCRVSPESKALRETITEARLVRHLAERTVAREDPRIPILDHLRWPEREDEP